MKLNEILATFQGGSSDLKLINKELAKLAMKLFYGGHFRVMDSKNVYLEEIEFYYHEENGSIKDPIMYHTNDHAANGKALPYFKLGRFNMHTSGVDVTFENEEKQYRASFLIRAYSVDNGPIERRSTFIYDDMFYMGIPTDERIEIEWVEDEMDETAPTEPLKGTWRKNVPMFEMDEDGNYQKVVTEETDEKTTFACNGVRYMKCDRPWHFIKKH